MAEESEDNICWVILNVYQEELWVFWNVLLRRKASYKQRNGILNICEYLLLFKVRTTNVITFTSFEKYL
jgi:hypothetical protein